MLSDTNKSLISRIFISSFIFTSFSVLIWWILGFFTDILPSVSLRGFGEVFIGIFIILSILTYIGIFILSLIFTSFLVSIWWILGFFTDILPSVSLRGFGEVFIGTFIALYILFVVFHKDEEKSGYKQRKEDPKWAHHSIPKYELQRGQADGGITEEEYLRRTDPERYYR